MTGTSTRFRTHPANSRCGLAGVPIGGITLASSASVSARPRITLKKSMPARVNAAAIRIASSGSTPAPSGRCSSNDIRMPTTKSSPTAARTAAITSSGNRMRFSSDRRTRPRGG